MSSDGYDGVDAVELGLHRCRESCRRPPPEAQKWATFWAIFHARRPRFGMAQGGLEWSATDWLFCI
jgi:hypothetical protein